MFSMVSKIKALILSPNRQTEPRGHYVTKVFTHLDKDESELLTLRKYNELLRGYLNEVVGPIDLENLEIVLGATLERKETRALMDSFLDSFQEWHHTFEKGEYK